MAITYTARTTLPMSCLYIKDVAVGDGKGDACQVDFDGDGVEDTKDNCPVNFFMSRTNFSSFLNTSLDFNAFSAPEWIISDEVCLSKYCMCIMGN